jgi:hypothetical protein
MACFDGWRLWVGSYQLSTGVCLDASAVGEAVCICGAAILEGRGGLYIFRRPGTESQLSCFIDRA